MTYRSRVGLKIVHMAFANDTEADPEEAVIIPQKMIYSKSLSRLQDFESEPAVTNSWQMDERVRSDDLFDPDHCSVGADEEQYQDKMDVKRKEEFKGNVELSPYPIAEKPLDLPQESLILTQELNVSSYQYMRLLPSKVLEMDVKRANILRKLPERHQHETRCECGFNSREGRMVGRVDRSNTSHTLG